MNDDATNTFDRPPDATHTAAPFDPDATASGVPPTLSIDVSTANEHRPDIPGYELLEPLGEGGMGAV